MHVTFPTHLILELNESVNIQLNIVMYRLYLYHCSYMYYV
jgi:hypothetical protein